MITGIGHVAFRVTDLERALEFYCDKLGFHEAFRLDREGEPSPWIVYLQIGPGQFVELFPGARDYLDVYARHGLVGPRSVFAHCVHSSDEALRRMAAAGAAAAFCPSSNLLLGSGLFSLGQACRCGVTVGLGDRAAHRHRARSPGPPCPGRGQSGRRLWRERGRV